MQVRATSVSKQVPGPAGPLEALVAYPAGGLTALALVCHPHPLHQGSMHNKVTVTLARSFEALGALTLRFNFRGVGASAGTYADGAGELDDARAVAAWMRTCWPGLPLHLGGFSFGAMITVRAAEALDAASLVSVAPPVRRLAGWTGQPQCPWLIIQGRQDEVVDCGEVEQWVAANAVRARLRIDPEAGHFFHGRLRELAEGVRSFLTEMEDFNMWAQDRA